MPWGAGSLPGSAYAFRHEHAFYLLRARARACVFAVPLKRECACVGVFKFLFCDSYA